jgi:hypothetical protein
LYLSSLKPKSLVDPFSILDVGSVLAKLGTGAYGYLMTRALNSELTSSPANRLFDDRQKRGQAWAALAQLPEPTAEEILRSHGFAEGAREGLLGEKRDEVLRARLDKLVEGERVFMQERGVVVPKQRIGRTIADSDVTDDDSVDAIVFDEPGGSEVFELRP